MGARGPAPKLRAVREREGKLAHRPLPEGVRLPPSVPAEPDWSEWFSPVEKSVHRPGVEDITAAALIGVARDCWARWTQHLDAYGVLALVDREALTLAVVSFAWAQFWTRNGYTNEAVKWSGQFISLAGKIGLTPSARDQLNPRDPNTGSKGWD